MVSVAAFRDWPKKFSWALADLSSKARALSMLQVDFHFGGSLCLQMNVKDIHSGLEIGMLLRNFVFSCWDLIFCYPHLTDGL